MLFRYQGVRAESSAKSSATTETIVHRAASGRLYTIEVSMSTQQPGKAYDARVAQMAAMNRQVGVCQGASREDVLRKAWALIDSALPTAILKAA